MLSRDFGNIFETRAIISLSHARVFLKLYISVHNKILPLTDLLYYALSCRSTAQKRFHDYISRTAADTVVLSQHELT